MKEMEESFTEHKYWENFQKYKSVDHQNNIFSIIISITQAFPRLLITKQLVLPLKQPICIH